MAQELNRSKKQAKPKFASIADIPVTEDSFKHMTKPDLEDDGVELDQPQNLQRTEKLNISELSSLLNSNSGSGCYSIEFPSLGRSFQFKQMTVAQQRSLAKQSADYENKGEQIRNRMALLKSLCLDSEFDPMEINWAEFFNAIVSIKSANSIDPIRYTITCQGEGCDAKYPWHVEFDEIAERLNSILERYSVETHEYEFDMNGNDIVFKLGFPKMKIYLSLVDLYQEDKKFSEDPASFDYPYIQQIFVNGREVDLSPVKNDIKKMMKFVDETFTGLSFRKFEKTINENFSEFINTMTEFETKCPKCGTPKSISLGVDDFFDL